MKCKRCNNKLTGKQTRYCSKRCSKLQLKSLYRKRNAVKIAEYNRRYRKKRTFINIKRNIVLGEIGRCFFCQSVLYLHIHHLSYSPERFVQLCRKCHAKHHLLVRNSNLVFK